MKKEIECLFLGHNYICKNKRFVLDDGEIDRHHYNGSSHFLHLKCKCGHKYTITGYLYDRYWRSYIPIRINGTTFYIRNNSKQ